MVAVLMPCGLVLGFPAEVDAPIQVVDNLHTVLLAVMKEAENLGYSGRYTRLAPVVTATFDIPFIARIIVGRYWRTFTDEKKTKFVETFRNLSIASYAGRFDGYSGERFTVVSTKALQDDYVMVKTLLIKRDGEEIELDYILHQVDNEWRVINVIADGVSDLSLKRADYTAFLKKKGFDALIDKLAEKISSYSDQPPKR
jgi:phospholipid transport system substrate-binding protein